MNDLLLVWSLKTCIWLREDDGIENPCLDQASDNTPLQAMGILVTQAAVSTEKVGSKGAWLNMLATASASRCLSSLVK
ncbi:Protein of unknown function, partial [Gryllus bimaculatus]